MESIAGGVGARTDAQRRGRLMWITPDRVYYAGLLGAPSVRAGGGLIVYVAAEGAIRIRLENGGWQIGRAAVVPPYVPHRVVSESRDIHVLTLEAESIDPAALPAPLRGSGVIDAPGFVAHVQDCGRFLCGAGPALELAALDFDRLFFAAPIAPRAIDGRILAVVDAIKRDPSAPGCAAACAAAAHLSVSRFLHLFKQETGAPFRRFRRWKRARSLLHHVHRDASLAHVALDTGYPDSTHFSHSIRQAYGLKPKDIFAGSRRLEVIAQGRAATTGANRP
jgi:AraC-like DNA-binding protein